MNYDGKCYTMRILTELNKNLRQSEKHVRPVPDTDAPW